MLKEKRTQAQKESEVTTNRLLAVIASTGVFIVAFSNLAKRWDFWSSREIAIIITQILFGVAAVGVLFSLYLLIRDRKRGAENKAVFNGVFFFWFFGTMLLTTGVILYNYLTAMRLVYVILPVSALLFLLYSVYQREFFFLTLTHTGICFLLYLLTRWTRMTHPNRVIAVLILGGAICLFGVAYGLLSKKNKGKMRLFGSEYNMLLARSNTTYICLVYLLSFIVLVLSYVLGAPYALYLFYGMLALWLVGAVYYTVTLI